MVKKNLKAFFKNKRVFITGHTGFKGTWLTSCLINFGAKVMGFSKKFVIMKKFQMYIQMF